MRDAELKARVAQEAADEFCAVCSKCGFVVTPSDRDKCPDRSAILGRRG